MVTSERLAELLHYDPDSGIFTRLVRTTNSIHVGDKAGWPDSHGYLKIMVDNVQYFAHRLAWLYMTGQFPAEQVDYINRNKPDNRWSNLRAVSNLENCRNQSLPKNNTSGHIGVHWHKQCKKWSSRIRVNGRLISLGLFVDVLDAAKARQAAEVKYGFHVNHGQAMA